MPYHSNATPYLSIDHDSIADWKSALSGQWFIGVVDTEKRSVKLAPVNIFDARGNLDSAVLNNARYHHSFSRATSMKRDGYFPGSAQLPLQWQHALTLFFNTTMNIPHVSVSND